MYYILINAFHRLLCHVTKLEVNNYNEDCEENIINYYVITS